MTLERIGWGLLHIVVIAAIIGLFVGIPLMCNQVVGPNWDYNR